MIRFPTLTMTVFIALLGTKIAWAQDADAMRSQNWDSIATAMVRFKAAQMPDAATRQSPLYGSLSDLNGDALPEIFVYTDPSNCVPDECGTTVFGLAGDQFVDLVEGPDEIKRTVPNKVQVLNDTRNRYFDIGFGDKVVSFNGSRYVDASTVSRGDFDVAGFNQGCLTAGESDYSIEEHGANVTEGRAKICGCIGERLAALGYTRADSDFLADKFKRLADDNYDNDYDDEDAHPVAAQMGDTRTACMVQSGWQQWSLRLGEGDETSTRQTLDFSSFIPNCAQQDWLASEKKIGSPDRALMMCGCVARKLAARGYDQAALDGVGRLYAWEINEDELAAVHASAADDSDTDLQGCLNVMPAR